MQDPIFTLSSWQENNNIGVIGNFMVRGNCCSFMRTTDDVNAFFQRRVIPLPSRSSVRSHSIMTLLIRKWEKMWEIFGSLVRKCNLWKSTDNLFELVNCSRS